MNRINPMIQGFSEACYNMNSIDELETALIDGPDKTDMKTWRITSGEWTQQINIALNEMRLDQNNNN